jgi:hypothetical protein
MDRRKEAEGNRLDLRMIMPPTVDAYPGFQKTFIVATLASTLVGTFTASMGLWERVSDRREKHKQKQRDTKQDGEIKQLREQFEAAQKKGQERQEEIDRLRDGRGGRGGERGRACDDVGESFERNGFMVQRMYDDMYGRMGSRFARGDGTSPTVHCIPVEEREY